MPVLSILLTPAGTWGIDIAALPDLLVHNERPVAVRFSFRRTALCRFHRQTVLYKTDKQSQLVGTR